MYRVFLISLLNLCFNTSGYHTTTTSSHTDDDERHLGEYNDDDGNKDKMNLMGLDYYNHNAAKVDRNEYFHDSTEDIAQMKMADPKVSSSAKSNIVVLDSQDARNYKAELLAGNKPDVLAANPNLYQPDTYPDFGRRKSHSYIDLTRSSNVEEHDPVPVWAPPEMVLAIAKESALLNAAESKNPTDEIIRKDILRTGNYWNAFWTDEVNPQLLRENNKKQLDTMEMEVRPQSQLYDLILKLKNISPTLLYIRNN